MNSRFAVKTFLPSDPVASLFPIGTILWRPCYLNKEDVEKSYLVKLYPTKTERDTFVFRCKVQGRYFYEPELQNAHQLNKETQQKTENKGVVVFCSDPIPDSWTHLIVTGHSKSARNSKESGGQCIYAKPGAFCAEYLDYRMDMAEDFVLDADIMKAVEISAAATRLELPPGYRRLFSTVIKRANSDESTQIVGRQFAHLET